VSGYAVIPVQRSVYVSVKGLLVAVTGLDPSLVLQGLPNRSAMPPAFPGFASMQIFRGRQLTTPQETWDRIGDNPTVISVEQDTELRCQLDLYGASSGDWGVMLQTLLRNEAGCVALAPACQPLYASDAQMVTLDDSEQQYEQRWTIEAVLQYNPVTSVPQDFSTGAEVTLINVEVTYPANGG
jgi:hypothetical protein